MDVLIRYIKKMIIRVILTPLKLFPVKKNKVILINDLAYNFSDNQKYVAKYLKQRYDGKFQIVFSVKDTNCNISLDNIMLCQFNSLRYFWHCMTSKVLVTNSGGLSYIPLRKKQYVINTWHGGGCYKKCGIDTYSNTFLFRSDLRLSSKQTNIFLSTNQQFSECLSKASLVERNKFWEIGMPRNDMMVHENSALRNEVRKKLGIKMDEKLVLFAPTYRKVEDNYFRDSIAISYGIDSERVLGALNKRFGGNWIFAIRLHPCVVNREEVVTEGMLDLTDYEDMQELLLAADVMINDFSSSMWDFMLTGKPCFTFAIDLQHYIETTEVYTPVSEWPFPKSTNNDELVKTILEFDAEEYRKRCDAHYQALGGCETGRATELVCERIYQVCFTEE